MAIKTIAFEIKNKNVKIGRGHSEDRPNVRTSLASSTARGLKRYFEEALIVGIGESDSCDIEPSGENERQEVEPVATDFAVVHAHRLRQEQRGSDGREAIRRRGTGIHRPFRGGTTPKST